MDYDGDGNIDQGISLIFLQKVFTIQKVKNADEMDQRRAFRLYLENMTR